MKIACITGITGQTGSYLAEILLDKGYEVHGMIRRSSSFNTERINHIFDHPNLKLKFGDLASYASIEAFVQEAKPDIFINCAAMSHVRVSFDIPEYTMDIDATGTLRCLEALRKNSPETHFLQCSTSELFGSTPPPQSEKTPFHPRSPYACAKIASYWLTVNYREAYGMHASNSISFNHECIGEKTPVIIKEDDVVKVCSVIDLISLRKKGTNVQTFTPKNLKVWDGNGWTKIKAITATKRRNKDSNHRMLYIEGRAGIVNTTSHHTMILSDDKEIKAVDVKTGDNLKLGNLPESESEFAILTEELAELLGLIVAEGCVSSNHMRFTNQDQELLDRVEFLWKKTFMGTVTCAAYPSGFENGNPVTQMSLNGNGTINKWISEIIYTKSKFKKVPDIIMNSPLNIKKAFMKGYYAGDGLKVSNSISIKTNSPFLAQGMCVLYNMIGHKSSVYVEHRKTNSGWKAYYQLNVLQNNSGKNGRKEPSEVRKISIDENPDEWVFDLETGSKVFMAGVGRAVIHNSPRRGETFVTRKITRAATRISLGLQDKLVLGNLEAKRDWSHAKDISRAMIAVVESDNPDDYVIGSEESHSVQEFLELVFNKLNLDWKKYVEFDERYLRPAEVDHLQADASKIKKALGWKPEYSFNELVDEMVESDLILARKEEHLKGFK